MVGEWALYPGSRFQGWQKSGKETYPVQVDIKHVDLSRSYLCGYLQIQGLTKEHPTLTTFFEAEIIGDKYSFATGKWNATEAIDRAFWSQFPQFEPYKQVGFSDYAPDFTDQNHLFMRWKEEFLVPDHSVTNISGASYAGFYYICFLKAEAQFCGFYYYHKNSEFQSLELSHIPERSFATFEFR